MIRNSLDRENYDYLKINVAFRIVKAGTSLQNLWDVSTNWKRKCTVNVMSPLIKMLLKHCIYQNAIMSDEIKKSIIGWKLVVQGLYTILFLPSIPIFYNIRVGLRTNRFCFKAIFKGNRSK